MIIQILFHISKDKGMLIFWWIQICLVLSFILLFIMVKAGPVDNTEKKGIIYLTILLFLILSFNVIMLFI